MRDIAEWLEELGLGEYAEAFVENKVDFRVLPELNNEDLREMDIPLGPRKSLLKAIAALQADGDAVIGTAGTAASKAASQDHPATEAERRQLTVMFVDLVGSTELSGRLDPEDLREVMRRYQDAVSGVVARYQGHVAKFLGDGVLAYFGWPRAHEDQAERAVRAGLDAVAAVSGLKLDAGVELRARVGIATGQIVIGDLVGEVGAVSGETPNLAARLQEVAASGEVVIGAATRRLIGEAFELVDLGSQALKGFVEPVPVWRVSGERATESRFEAAHAGRLTAFVGREEEVDLLARRWQQAEGGEGQIVLLSGEAGIGKSRIAQTLSDRTADRRPVRLRLQCSPHHANSALYPFISHLERASGFVPADGPEARLDKLEALLAQATEDVARVAPLLGALLSVPLGDRYPPLELTPPLQKLRTLEALADQLLGLAARRPVLMIFEDVHWADPTTLEALELVIDRVRDARVLGVITFRPEFAPPWHGHAHVTALALNRLGREQCAAMVPDVARGKPLPDEVLDQIVAKTDGVPLFVEELTKTVIESGILEEKAERYELTGPLPPLAIPSTLRDSLMARLDRLAPVKEVAQIGAAIGREFSQGLVAAVSPLSDDELDNALEQLVEAELVFRRGRPPDATYIFKHALVQDAAYESLLKSKRQQLHERIAQILEERFPEMQEIEPEIFAHHYTEASLFEPAITYRQLAGQRAIEKSAAAEAANQFEMALELLSGFPESSERDQQELEVRVAFGGPLVMAKGHASPEVETNYKRTLELCRNAGETPHLVTALFGLWRYFNAHPDFRMSKELAEQLGRLGEREGETATFVLSRYALGFTFYCLGDLVAARTQFEDGYARYDPAQRSADAFRMGQDPGVACLSYGGITRWLLGEPEAAIELMEQARSLADELADPFSQACVDAFGACLHQFRRDPGNAKAWAEAALGIADEHGFPIWAAMANINRGWALVKDGDLEDGIEIVRESLAAMLVTGLGAFRPYYMCFHVEALAALGRTTEALETVDEALALVERTGERWWEAELHRLKGECLLAQAPTDSEAAEACFLRALEQARSGEAKSLELRSATSLARLFWARGRAAEARSVLAPVYSWFTEGFDTPDLKDAKALLDEMV